MESTFISSHSIPVVATVDVLIIGGTSQAVSLALSLKKQGVSVYLVAPRSYLGEDICAAYRFWPKAAEGNELSQQLFGDLTSPPTPMHVKLTLEQRLIDLKIPFLLNCFSAGLLKNEDAQICGAAIANRSGHQAIQARLVVDATLEASVLRLAGCEAIHTPTGKQDVEFVTVCEGEGTSAEGAQLLERLPGYECEDFTLTARRYRVEVDFGAGTATEQARAYSSVVEACWVPTEYRHQLALTALREPSLQTVDVQELMVGDGLLALTESACLAEAAESVWLNPIAGMRAAELIAQQVYEALPVASFDSLQVSCAGAQPLKSGEVRTLRDALRPGAVTAQQVAFDPTCLPVLDTFDVVVAGGGTGGAPAAISAARAGARTLVVEVTSALGGVGTMGQIATYWCGNRVGFTAEIDAGVKALESKEFYQQKEGVWSVAAKCEWYHKTGYDLGCTYWLNTLCVGTVVEGDRVTGLIVAGPYGYGLVQAGCIVDSTGCSDIPAAAGAPTCVIGKEHVAVQGTGLAGMKPGREYHNSDHSFSDDTDVTDATAFFVSSKLKFKDDFDCGELVDSRERRQIVGDCSLSPVDILMNRRSSETICVATSNFDSHGFTVDPVFMLVPPNKDPLWADIPFGCMLPQGLDGVLVTGLGMSAHRDALPVIRMQADVQNQGYAAGVIAARSADAQCAVRAVDISAVQQHLVDIGGLPERVLTDADNFPVDDATLLHAIEHDWDTLKGVSLMLNEGERSLRLVGQAYAAICGKRSTQSLRYAQVLALLGDSSAQAELIAEISDRDWDDGWQFRGMHQFGRNMSELDSLLVCLGAIGDASAWSCVLDKVESLPLNAAFSHVRAIAMVCEQLHERAPNAAIVPALARILKRSGYAGHAHADIDSAQAALTNDINENGDRNSALRELHLARALYRCGDEDSLGEATLRTYSQDYRGHFARHASAILNAPACVMA